MSKYTDLIISQYRDKIKFKSTVDKTTELQIDIQNLFDSISISLDINSAVGEQLNILAQIVNLNRNNFPETVDDVLFRKLIIAKSRINLWKGTIPEMIEIWGSLGFGNSTLIVIDNQDMTMDLAFVNTVPTDEEKIIAFGGYLLPKPSTVGIRARYILPTDGKMFVWDGEGDTFAGWDEGQWAISS